MTAATYLQKLLAATHLQKLLAAANLQDREECLMLSDEYEAAGLDDDAAELRSDEVWQIAGDKCWFAKNIRQTTGYTEPDEFGRTLSYERELLIETDFAHHASGWSLLSPSARRWWYDLLEDLHDATVALEESSPEVREWFDENADLGDVELEYQATTIRDLIAQAEAAS